MTTILCIDDETDLLDVFKQYLSLKGFDVLTATNGREGLHILLQESVDIIICDVNMPEMSGFDLRNELRMYHPELADIPFIFLTAMGMQQHMLRGRELGCDDYMVKPVDMDMLLSSIEAIQNKAHRIKRLQYASLDGFRHYLLRVLTHDLRTPLNAILGFSEVLKNNTGEAKSRAKHQDLIQEIHNAGFQQLQLLNTVLDTLILTSQKQEEATITVSLTALNRK